MERRTFILGLIGAGLVTVTAAPRSAEAHYMGGRPHVHGPGGEPEHALDEMTARTTPSTRRGTRRRVRRRN